MGIKVVDRNLICSNSTLSAKMNGRYSKYNCEGRQVRRKGLPKIGKAFEENVILMKMLLNNDMIWKKKYYLL